MEPLFQKSWNMFKTGLVCSQPSTISHQVHAICGTSLRRSGDSKVLPVQIGQEQHRLLDYRSNGGPSKHFSKLEIYFICVRLCTFDLIRRRGKF